MAFSRGLEDALRSLDEAAGLLEAAAGRLRDAAEQLRRAAGDGPGGGGPGAPDALPGGYRGAASGEDPAAYVARHLARAVVPRGAVTLSSQPAAWRLI